MKKISTLMLATALVAGSLIIGSGPASAKGGGGGGGGNNGGGGTHSGHQTNQGSNGNQSAKNQSHRCLVSTCGVSRAIDNAASNVYQKMKFW
jgi:hypothetical protein